MRRENEIPEATASGVSRRVTGASLSLFSQPFKHVSKRPLKGFPTCATRDSKRSLWANRNKHGHKRDPYFSYYRRERKILKDLSNSYISPYHNHRSDIQAYRFLLYKVIPFLLKRLTYLPDWEALMRCKQSLSDVMTTAMHLRNGRWRNRANNPRVSSSGRTLLGPKLPDGAFFSRHTSQGNNSDPMHKL